MNYKYRLRQLLLYVSLFILGGLLVYSSLSIYTYLDNYQTNESSVLETYQFQKQYMKYIERLTLYLHYTDEGYQVDLTSLSDIKDLNDPIDTNVAIPDRNNDTSKQDDFDFYNYRLNLQSTNFIYYAQNKTTGKIYYSPYLNTLYPNGNVESFVDQIETNHCYFSLNTQSGKYATNMDKNSNILSKSNLSWIVDTLTEPIPLENGITRTNDYIIYTGVISGFPKQEDEFYTLNQNYTKYRSAYKKSIYLFPVCGLLSVFLIFMLIGTTGKLPASEEAKNYNTDNYVNHILLNSIDRLPTELFILLVLVYILVAAFTSNTIFRIFNRFDLANSVYYIIEYVLYAPMFLVGFSSIIRRIKSKTLLSNSLLFKLVPLLSRLWKQFFENHTCTYRIGLLLLGFILLQSAGIFLAIRIKSTLILICFLIISYLFLGYCLLKQAIDLGTIFRQAKEMQEGNLTTKIPVENMSIPMNVLGDYINNISDGLSVAVEERLKSERFKTELITNVSHDIKTPLTSIINYVDLLKKEPIDNENAQRYLEILTTKSWRLKTLIEDLVEASKASVGAIKMQPQRLNLLELVRQSTGEYDDRLHANSLEVIINAPETPIAIYADGRSTYRIIENLLSNANKYALPGTRIYVDIFAQGNYGFMTIKNISKEKLNITADELMERFVRGDRSRNTEGSGLGLSIARSLANLQNGEFNLELDGDLFKASISLPLAPETNYPDEPTKNATL